MRLAEGHVMTETSRVPRKSEGERPQRRPLVDDELADQLLGKARAEGAELLGPDGLLSQVTKVVLERALAEEMTGHLGYEKHDPAGRGSGNSRNGPICLICAVAGPPELDLSAAQIGGYTRSPAARRVLACKLRHPPGTWAD